MFRPISEMGSSLLRASARRQTISKSVSESGLRQFHGMPIEKEDLERVDQTMASIRNWVLGQGAAQAKGGQNPLSALFTWGNRTATIDESEGGDEHAPPMEVIEQHQQQMMNRVFHRNLKDASTEDRMMQNSVNLSKTSPDTLINEEHGVFNPEFPIEGLGSWTSIFPSLTSEASIDAYRESRAKVREYVGTYQKFNEQIKEIQGRENNQEISENLYHFFSSNRETLHEIEQGDILRLLWDLDEYDKCVQTVVGSPSEEFRNNPDTMMIYARAQLKSDYFNPSHAEKIAETLTKRGYSEPEVDGLKGVIEAIKMNASRQMLPHVVGVQGLFSLERLNAFNNDLKLYSACFPDQKELTPDNIYSNYVTCLDKSLNHYQKAWEKSRDPRYGIRVVHRLMEGKKLLESQGQMEEAEKLGHQIKAMAKMVQIACIRDGVNNPSRGQDHQALSRAMLEAFLVLEEFAIPKEGMDRDWLVSRVILGCDTPSRTKYAIMSLNDLLRWHPHPQLIRPIIAQLQHHLIELEQAEDPGAFMQELNEKSKPKNPTTTQQIEEYATDYKRATNVLHTGNACYGGALPEHNVNKHDRRYFEKMLDTPVDRLPLGEDLSRSLQERGVEHLGDIEDPKEFSQVLNYVIRHQFGTDRGLERLDSPYHVEYDATVDSVFSYVGASTPEHRKYLPDTRTGISLTFASGLGDCRHHAQVKQLLFDLWQRKKVASLEEELQKLELIIDPSESEVNRKAELTAQIKKTINTQMRTFTCEFHGPIAMEKDPETGMTIPVWENGHMVMSDDAQETFIEQHTFNALLHFDDNGACEEFDNEDSFYQSTYPLHQGTTSLKGKVFSHDAEPIEICTTPVYNKETGQVEKVPIRIRPADFSKIPGKYDRSNAVSKFWGVPTAANLDPQDLFTPSSRENVDRAHEVFRTLREENHESSRVIED